MQSLSPNESDRPLDVLIKLDHESLWNLYDRYLAAAASSTASNPQEQQKIANELVREIAVHSHAEETAVYGVIEAEEGRAVAEGLRNDHQKVKILLSQLDAMTAGSPDHAALLDKIITELRDHTREEETKDLPLLRAKVGDERMIALGHAYAGAKRIVPTRPHPSAPNKPATELMAGMVAGPMDKVRDMGREFAERKVPEE